MYRYIISYWEDTEFFTEKGIVGAETYGEAADKVASAYGEKLDSYCIDKLVLWELEDLVSDRELVDHVNED